MKISMNELYRSWLISFYTIFSKELKSSGKLVSLKKNICYENNFDLNVNLISIFVEKFVKQHNSCISFAPYKIIITLKFPL